MRKKATVFASISGCIAVILGALGAHALSRYVDSGLITKESFHAYETAVHYQLLHSIAIIAIVALQYKFALYFKPLMNLMMAGIVLFSGSIYLLVLGEFLKINLNWIGPVTPLGGLCLIAAWFTLFLSALKYKEKEIPPPSPPNTPQS
jgi:uncharacterized membrane protein YgdD (TMEM256/DUF423 family)